MIRNNTTNDASQVGQQSKSPTNCQPWGLYELLLLQVTTTVKSKCARNTSSRESTYWQQPPNTIILPQTNDMRKVYFLDLTVCSLVFTLPNFTLFDCHTHCSAFIPFTYIYTHRRSLTPVCDWLVGVLWLCFLFSCVELSFFVAEW